MILSQTGYIAFFGVMIGSLEHETFIEDSKKHEFK